ncbi:adenylyltransferase and sulfurtransferase MOCS3 [Parasteatoda tepidariorum]|uniref:adenylyltransferase and sulfurtransferase MOCS3 n=1 Tax=Parasteatoda tepidariorum TaxID=114398 RepID=UPI00077FBF74|nr:adenylyltransferase and sulfurtransferase MOCS3-like [Parasteatoda tepidariorum]
MSDLEKVKKLKSLIQEKEAEINKLKALLKEENEKNHSRKDLHIDEKIPLSHKEIKRYSRQLILPEIGVSGQISLKKTSVLIVGAGGLGCPVGLYLAAAGVGCIGIVDYDRVDVTNLHRQIAHKIELVGQKKCDSLQQAIKEINPLVKCNVYPILLNSTNITEIIDSYNIIVDASDNVPTRYLLNDAAVLFNKHLVSGSALRFEGQLTVYNYLDGPCYRCLFPKPPSSSNVGNCSENGVLGAVTGVIGCLQSLEVIKIAVGIHPTYHKKMLLFDGLNGDMRTITLRSRKLDCDICGNNPSIKQLIDYELFCQQSASDKIDDLELLPDSERISCNEYKKIMDNGLPHILLDVRPSHEIEICCLPNSLNIPINEITLEASVQKLQELIQEKNCQSVFIICRRGNDSQTAVVNLKKVMSDYEWKDIKGGLIAWHNEIDTTLPLYYD